MTKLVLYSGDGGLWIGSASELKDVELILVDPDFASNSTINGEDVNIRRMVIDKDPVYVNEVFNTLELMEERDERRSSCDTGADPNQ